MSRVIIIDDDKDHSSILSEVVESAGGKVDGMGTNGLDAVKLFAKHRPNIVFLDIGMPEFDGFYAIEKIKGIDTSAKIFAVTGDVTQDTEKRLKDYDISVVYKPFDIKTIAKIIEEGK